MKIKLIFIISILLLLFSTSIKSQAPNHKVVSDITSNNWRVKWIELENDLDHKLYQINITNLLDVNRDFNLTLLINNATFNLQRGNLEFYELKNVTGWELVPVFAETISLCNGNQTCSQQKLTGYNNETFNRITWKPAKNQILRQNSQIRRESIGLINIPKSSAKDKNDGVVGATKQFLFRIDNMPIGRTDTGWGNKVKLSIIDESTGTEYHPWANTTYGSYINISAIDVRTPMIARILEPVIVNVSVTSFSLPNTANFYNGTRLLWNLTEEIPFQWISGNNNTWAKIVFMVNKSSNGPANFSFFFDCDATDARYCSVATDNINNPPTRYWNFTFRNQERSTDFRNHTGHYSSAYPTPGREIGSEWGSFQFLDNVETNVNHYQMAPDSPAGTCEFSEVAADFGGAGGIRTNKLQVFENGSIRARYNITSKDSSAYEEVTVYHLLPLVVVKQKCLSSGPWAERSNVFSTTRRIFNASATGQGYSSAFIEAGAGTSMLYTGIPNSKSSKRWIAVSNASTQTTHYEVLYAFNTTNFADTNGIRVRDSTAFAIGRGDNQPTDASAPSSSFDTGDSITFYDAFFLRRGRFGNASNMTYEGFITNPLQTKLSQQQFLASTKITFYVNQTNASRPSGEPYTIRTNSALTFGINWTVNQSLISLSTLTFETNITGTKRNFTNSGTDQSQKMNITNRTNTQKGYFYWKSYAVDGQSSRNSTNRMFILVDNKQPLARVIDIPSNTLNPGADFTITDNLELDICWYNVTTQAAPNTCAAGFTCPTFFSCGVDPTLSNLVDGQSYRLWLTANDTSGNINATRGNNPSIFNWTVNIGGGGDSGGGGGGGGLVDQLFSLGMQCTEDTQCASGICDTVSNVCTIGLCGNGICDREKGENFAQCSQDCGTIQAFTSGLPGGIAGAAIVGVVGLSAFFLFKPKKRKKVS